MSDILFVSKPEVVDCDIGGDRALLHLDTNTYFTMNATASALWLALSEPKSLEALVQVITETFDVTAAVCQADIEALINQMVAAQVVETVAPKTAG